MIFILPRRTLLHMRCIALMEWLPKVSNILCGEKKIIILSWSGLYFASLEVEKWRKSFKTLNKYRLMAYNNIENCLSCRCDQKCYSTRNSASIQKSFQSSQIEFAAPMYEMHWQPLPWEWRREKWKWHRYLLTHAFLNGTIFVTK